MKTIFKLFVPLVVVSFLILAMPRAGARSPVPQGNLGGDFYPGIWRNSG